MITWTSPRMPEITWYRASDHYPNGMPLFSRGELARIKRWLAKRQLELETE